MKIRKAVGKFKASSSNSSNGGGSSGGGGGDGGGSKQNRRSDDRLGKFLFDRFAVCWILSLCVAYSTGGVLIRGKRYF